MASAFLVPLKVMGIGILVSYGIAVLMRVTINCIRHFENMQSERKKKKYLKKSEEDS